MLEAVALWINRRLFGLAEYSSHRRWLGLLLEWGLVACACLGLAYWFVRQTRRARGLEPENASRAENAPGMRNWQVLHREAEEAAQQQCWRDAVRSYYWATIARFESRGQWPADYARTPREYLRLIGTRASQYPVLKSLTRKLELVWYGYGSADEADFQETLAQLEKLGCR